jgi:hypothetical protein
MVERLTGGWLELHNNFNVKISKSRGKKVRFNAK